jgi:hypothetical protein
MLTAVDAAFLQASSVSKLPTCRAPLAAFETQINIKAKAISLSIKFPTGTCISRGESVTPEGHPVVYLKTKGTTPKIKRDHSVNSG